MIRDKVKQLLPIMQAFADGKDIQIMHVNGETNEEEWLDIYPARYDVYESYRVKPQPKYRPFKDAAECWQEMQKHQPFGWVKTEAGEYRFIDRVTSVVHLADQGKSYEAFCGALEAITFADGAPFGVKEEHNK